MLELALDPGAGLQQAEVEHPQADVLQGRRHVAGGDTQGQPFCHGGLAHAGGADQDRVVLPAAQEDVDALADLAVTPDYGVDAPGMGVGGEVLGVLVEDGVLGARLGGLALGGLGGAGRLLAGGLGPFLEVAAQGFAGDAQQRRGAVQQQGAALVAVEQGE
ncbi:hypothetical protein D3C76_1321950 [compost metagenome]